MRYQLGSWGLSSALLASACSLEDVDSDAIRTQAMFAEMLALAPGDRGTLVRVQLTVGGENGTNITLVGDDRLDGTYAEVSARLRRSGHGRYEVRLDGDAAGTVSVALARGADDTPAGGAAELPEPFQVELASDASSGIDRASEVAVTWAPGVDGGSMGWAVEGACIWSESGVTPDDGVLVLAPERFRVRGTQTGRDCDVALTLERENVGSVDRTWALGSRFRAVQRRRLSFVSTPAGFEVSTVPEAPDEVPPDAG